MCPLYGTQFTYAFATTTKLFSSLEKGEIELAIVDSVAAFHFIFSSENDYYILSDSLAEEEYGVGFRENDQKLRDKIQEILVEMKTDGTLGKISKDWFGSDITIVK